MNRLLKEREGDRPFIFGIKWGDRLLPDAQLNSNHAIYQIS
jgi:hypothetical protein